jgi:hypothetical protein
MADEAETTVDDGDDGATYTKADMSRIVAERLAKERAKHGDIAGLKAKAARLDEIEAANKTELEKATEARRAVERERDEARAELLRRDVATRAGLPAELAARLRGGTEAELEADARELSKLVPRLAAPTSPRPVAALQPGALGAGSDRSTATADDWIRAQVHRQK